MPFRFFSALQMTLLFLACVLWLGCQGQAAPPYQPPPGVDAQHYALDLSLDPETGEINAALDFRIAHPDTLRVLPLLFNADLQLDTALVGGRAANVERRGDLLLVPLSGGTDSSHVRIVYSGTPPVGLYAGEHGGQRVFYTDSWPYRARGWLPGVHHPSDPATLDLALRLPVGYEAVASGAPGAVDTLGGAVRSRWRLAEPAPTYSFAFAAADFDVVDGADVEGAAALAPGRVPVRYYMLDGGAAGARRLRRTPEVIDYFSGLIGPYPFARYASVEVPISYAGMENASAAFLRASLFDESGNAAEAVQVHEAAHQWFGDRVVIENWRDLWLSEGMATYLTSLFYEHADGEEAAHARRATFAALSSAQRRRNRALVPAGPVDPSAHLDWVPYRKGASVLHLLRLTLGDEAFFTVLRTAYAQYADEPLSTEDFKALLERISGQDLTDFFAVWVYEDALPTLETTWDDDARTLSWQIEDDGGTLAGVPFLLEVRQGDAVRYVEARRGSATLAGSEAPDVRPVGVMLVVE